jgi:hypothetical protein
MSSVRQRVITLLKREAGVSTHAELYDIHVSESSINYLKYTSGIESEKIDEVILEFRVRVKKNVEGRISNEASTNKIEIVAKPVGDVAAPVDDNEPINKRGGPDGCGWVLIIGLSLMLVTCVNYFGSDDRLTRQQRAVKEVCEAAGGCY